MMKIHWKAFLLAGSVWAAAVAGGVLLAAAFLAATPSDAQEVGGPGVAYVPNASVGEYHCVQVTNGGSPTGCDTNTSTPISLTTGTPVNLGSLSLTAGDWEVQCALQFLPASTTVFSQGIASINTTSAVLNTNPGFMGQNVNYSGAASGGNGDMATTPIVRESLSATTTVYCVAQSGFSTSTETVVGFLRARRIR